MKIATCELSSMSTLSLSRRVFEPKLDKEKPDDYEKRTWRLKTHVNDKGQVIIPPIAFKFALESAASMLRERIPGKGQSEYGKHFKAGILVTDEVVVAESREALVGEWFDMNANGRRGPGTRVQRMLPQIAKWKGIINFYVLDETIPEDVFERHLREAGKLVGIGQFRPQNGGYCGRFNVDKIKWSRQ